MSLEAAIETLSDNIAINNDLLKQLLSKSPAGAKAPEAASSGEGGATRTRRSKAQIEADNAAAAAAKKKVTVEDLKDIGTRFKNVDDEDERADRIAFLKKINKKFGCAKLTEVPAENRAEAYKMVEMAMKGENVEFDDEQGEDDDGV